MNVWGDKFLIKGRENILAQTDFEKQITEVITALSDAGYDPYAQLTGFVQTGDDTFITRRENAREKIRTLDKNEIKRFLEIRGKRL